MKYCITCSREVCIRGFSIEFDDVIPVVEVVDWVFVRELPTEKFRQALHLNLVNAVDIEPGTATWDDE